MKFKLKIDIPDSYKRVTRDLLLVVSLVWFFNYVGIFSTMSMRPASVHIWSQTERASIALNYAKWDMNFFHPRIHRFEKGDEGITGLEFPLVQYVPAICYKLFGFNEIYYRLFVFITLLFGLYFFYRLLCMVTNNYLLSLGMLAAPFLSPALVYFSNNFMPDVTSLGFVLAGWYFFFKYVNSAGANKRYYTFYWFLMLIAILIKITSFISLTAAFCLVLLDHFKFFYRSTPTGSLFKKEQRRKIVIGYFGIIILVAAWYIYAKWLTTHYETEGFLLSHTILTNWQDFVDIWNYIDKIHKYEYLSYEGYVLFGIIFGVLIIGYKFVSRVYMTLTVLILFGNILFVYLFFSQIQNHEYYIIPLLPLLFMMSLTFADFLKRLSLKYSRFILYVFLVILFFNIKESARACKRDFTMKYEQKFIRWVSNYEAYNDLEPKLRKVGIKRNDYTLAGFDWSFCNSLYLMDQLGCNIDENMTKEKIKSLIENPRYKYLVISDSAKLNKLYPNDFANKIITTHRGLIVYKLR